VSKLDLAVIAAVVVCTTVWIEARHRVLIEETIRPEQSACPDNDNQPYSENCLRFLSGRFWHASLPERVP